MFTDPPFAKPGTLPKLIASSMSTPMVLAVLALITYSPFESIAGMESLVGVPGPLTKPPAAIGIYAGPPPVSPDPGPVDPPPAAE